MGGRRKTGGKSLYEQSPKAWSRLSDLGFPNLSRMSRFFSVPSFMDKQLGSTNAVSKWHRGIGVPRMKWEDIAGVWLADNAHATIDMHEIERRKKGHDQYVPPMEDEEEVQPSSGAVPKVFVFVCDETVAPKLLKIARMLNCAVEEL